MNAVELLNQGLRYLFAKKTKESADLEDRERQMHDLNRQMNQLLERQESDSTLRSVESRLDHA